MTEFNFDATFDAFVSVVHSVIENHAPLKRLSRKEQKLKRKPWITKDIYAMIRRKNIMHKSHYILGNETMKQKCKKYSNKLTQIKSTAKKQCYAKELEANTGNPRKTWEVLRTLLPVNGTKSSALPSAIDLNGSKVTDQQIMLL